MPSKDKSRKAMAVLIAGALLIAAFVAAYLIVGSLDYRNSDFFSFWLAGKLALNGLSPYSPSLWVEGHREAGATWLSDEAFLYPLPVAYLFSPFGSLPLQSAFIAWLFLTTILVITAVVILTQPGLATPWNIVIPLVVAVFLFRPTFVTYHNGQLSPLFLAILATTMFLLRGHRWLAAGIEISLLLLKPSLGFPMVVLFASWLLTQRRWQAIAGLALGTGLLLLVGLASDPAWIGKYMGIGAQKLTATLGYSPTLWGIIALELGDHSGYLLPLGLLLSAIILTGVLLFTAALPKSTGPDLPAAAIVAASLFVTPYLWAYDLLLLIFPLAIVVTSISRAPGPYLAIAILPIAFALASLILIPIAQNVGRDAWSALLTAAALVAVVWIGSKEMSAHRNAA